MQEHEAHEFEKLFGAMDRRFRAQYDFPVYITGLMGLKGWILSRTPKNPIWFITQRRKASSAGMKGLHGLKKTTNLYEFQIWKGDISFYSGKNLNVKDLGPRRAEARAGTPWYNWIGSTKNLFKKLGMVEEVRANLSDPKLLEDVPCQVDQDSTPSHG